MKLYKYIEFLNESSKYKQMLVYSKRFIGMVRSIQDMADSEKERELSAMCEHILDQSYELECDITMIDIDFKQNDMISFIQSSRVIKKYGESSDKETGGYKLYNILRDDENPFWKEQRGEIKIGKFIRRILTDNSIKDATIEKFVNRWKSEIDYINSPDISFELVSGDEIKKWYLSENYQKQLGTLGNSCMRYKKCQDYFDIYTMNKDVCSLLILKDKSDISKIVGRALVWKLRDGETFMDRVYTIRDSDESRFQKWAIDKNYLYKNKSDIRKNGIIYSNDLIVDIDAIKYKEYPYIDTLFIYNYLEGYLTNNDNWPQEGLYKCQETDGTYQTDNVVFSKYHDMYIDKDKSIYFDDYDDWVSKDDCIHVEKQDLYFHPNDSDKKVFYSFFDSKYYLEKDINYSDKLSTAILKENSIEAIINENGDLDYFPKSKDYCRLYENKYYINDLLLKDNNSNEFIPWFVTVKLFWCKNTNSYMMKKEADRQRLSLDTNKFIDVKYIDYFKEKSKLDDAKIVENIKSLKIERFLSGLNELLKIKKEEFDEYCKENDVAQDEIELTIRRYSIYASQRGYGLYMPYWNQTFNGETGWSADKTYNIADAIYDSYYNEISELYKDILKDDEIMTLNNYLKLIKNGN